MPPPRPRAAGKSLTDIVRSPVVSLSVNALYRASMLRQRDVLDVDNEVFWSTCQDVSKWQKRFLCVIHFYTPSHPDMQTVVRLNLHFEPPFIELDGIL
jgi:hypothetical protein